MNTSSVLLRLFIGVQIYYLYKFIYSIPAIRETSGIRKTDNFLEMHMRKPLPQLPLKQTTRDNNTALIYRFAASLGVVSPF